MLGAQSIAACAIATWARATFICKTYGRSRSAAGCGIGHHQQTIGLSLSLIDPALRQRHHFSRGLALQTVVAPDLAPAP